MVAPVESLESIVQWLRAELAVVFDRPIGDIDPSASFAQLGVDSGTLTHLAVGLEDLLGIELDPDIVADLKTVDALAVHAHGVRLDRLASP